MVLAVQDDILRPLDASKANLTDVAQAVVETAQQGDI